MRKTIKKNCFAPLTIRLGAMRRATMLLLATLLLTMTAQTAWADEVVTLQQDGSEWYVNMPSSGTSTLTLDDASITTFKVYDDGGKGGTGYSYSNTTGGNYSNNCNGYLVLTAPDGYLLRLSGSISSELNYDRLTVYDGSTTGDTKLLDEVGSTSVGTETAITTVVSSGPSMRIRFYSDYYRNYAGLDLTVTLVSASTEYNITVNNPVTGGNVASDKASAKANETITLTATPANGHVLSDVSVTDASGEAVALSWNVWTNSATFTMPASAVTVTPTFTSDLTSLSINMPKTGTKSATIPSGVQSFNVYDDGGSGNNYSPNCDGTLVLTAPEGYVLQLSGNISAEAGYDYLRVYDGSTTSSAKLLDKVSSSTSYGAKTDITTVTSSGQSMRLYFYSSRDENFAGLDLTVTLISTSTENNITVNNTATGGTIVSDKNTAIQGETVTLTATPADGYILNDVSVTDAIGNTIDLNWNTWTNSATFTMPAYAVSITPTFSNMTSLFVNMPKNGTKTATIPSGVTSFKVYDDGGSEKNYSDWCDGTLVLTAPEGKVLKLSGNIRADGSNDYLTVYNGIYDGTISAGTILLNKECSTEKTIAPISSTSESMTLYFYSDNKNNYAGLDLTVTLVSTGTEYGVTINNPTTGGIIAASINGSSVTNAMANETITLTATPESSYLLSDVSVTDESGNAIAVDVNFCNNTASFTMPASSVTIIPKFTNTLTADGGLYINMPATSYESVTIPSGVQSFKVYDDGGVTGNYSGGCNGTLVVTAPIGYVLQLSGNITTDNGFDLLTVYDGNDISTKLIDAVYSSSANTETAITTVTSSGQSMRIYFTSNDLYNYAGLDLTVTVVPITYIVSFQKNNNDATGTMDAQTHTFDAELALTANSFEYTGYAFAGWATTADGEKAYDDQQSVSNLSTTKGANVELFAKWNIVTYNITYNGVEGATNTNPATYTIESQDITLDAPTKDGYTFAGWYGNSGFTGDAITSISSGSTGDKTFWAKWKKLMTNTDISITIPEQTYTGSALTPVITVKDGETVLTETTDYTVTAPSGTVQNAGNYIYTITGAGNYTGETTATFTIAQKAVTGTGISIDIPSQEWTGGALTFDANAVIVKDGETTLTQNTHYTVTAPSGTIQDAGEYTYTITGAGNYSGETTAKFTIVPKTVTNTNITNSDLATPTIALTQDQNGLSATLDGASEGSFSISADVDIADVKLNRMFEAGKKVAICWPFAVTTSEAAALGTFYEFVGINTDGQIQMQAVTGDLTANTPYIFEPTNAITTPIDFGAKTLKAGGPASVGSGFTFKGVYSRIKWTTDTTDPLYDATLEGELGKAYGFALEDITVGTTSYSKGQFVKLGSGANSRPMRAYMLYDGMWDGNQPSLSSSHTRSGGLPDVIEVVWLGANGEETGISSVVISHDNDAWYSIDGRRLSSKPTVKGLYINNGRKVVIK